MTVDTHITRADWVARLREAFGNALYLALDAPQLWSALRSDLPDVVIVGTRDAAGKSPVEIIRQIHGRYPSLPIRVYCELSAGDMREIPRLAMAGVHPVRWTVRDLG